MKFSKTVLVILSFGGLLSACEYLLAFLAAELMHNHRLIAILCLLGIPALLAGIILSRKNKRWLPFLLGIEILAAIAFAGYVIRGSLSRYELNIPDMQKQIIMLWLFWGLALLTIIYGIVVFIRNRKRTQQNLFSDRNQ